MNLFLAYSNGKIAMGLFFVMEEVFYFYRSIWKMWRIWLLEIKCFFEINIIKEFLIHKIVMNNFMFVIDLGQTKFDVKLRFEASQFANQYSLVNERHLMSHF